MPSHKAKALINLAAITVGWELHPTPKEKYAILQNSSCNSNVNINIPKNQGSSKTPCTRLYGLVTV